MDPAREPGVRFSQVFLNELHFKQHPNALSIDARTPIPKLPVDMSLKVLDRKDKRAAAAFFKVETSNEAEDLLYRMTVEMVAVVEAIPGEENIEPSEYAKNFAPSALYPFVRELIANITQRARFGPVWLAPFNFTLVRFEEQDHRAENAGHLIATNSETAKSITPEHKAKRLKSRS
jgi:preprotein translocase subunit SecB